MGDTIGSMFGGGGGSATINRVNAPGLLAGGISSYLAEDDGNAVAGYISDVAPHLANHANPAIRNAYQQSLDRKAAVQGIKDSYLGQAGTFRDAMPRFEELFGDYSGRYGDMLGMVAPGFGRLTDARVTAIDNARERERGNLRASLNKRRVLGSSFGDNALNRSNVAYAQEEERARAQSFLEELDMTQKLTSDQMKIDVAGIETSTELAVRAFQAEAASEQVTMDEMNLFFNAANSMAASGMAAAQANQQMEMQVANMKAAGAGGSGSFFGDLLGTVGGSVFGPVGSAIGGQLSSSLFGGGSSLSGFGGGGGLGASSIANGFSGMGI